ncbi:MAG: hypothetical protein F4X83_00105 [Chloroflexi bacterium]|nr:hypothetical protein [Chloroflexota bacterium]
MELHLLRSFLGYWKVIAGRLKPYGRCLLLSVVFGLILLAMIIVSAILVVSALANGVSLLILPVILLFLSACYRVVNQFIKLSDCAEEDLTDKIPRLTEQAAPAAIRH